MERKDDKIISFRVDDDLYSKLEEVAKRDGVSVQNKIQPELTQKQFDALVSFTFNLGEGWMGKSGLGDAIQAAKFEQAAETLKLYSKAKGKNGNLRVLNGLIKRRDVESQMLRPENRELTEQC